MNYGEIKTCDIANGEGVRVSLFVSGCTHHCKNCFNDVAWDFGYGKPFTEETEEMLLKALEPDFVDGLSLLGGEPFEPENHNGAKERVSEAEHWALFDKELLGESRARCECTDEMLSLIDVLVDGEFVQELYSVALAFRGSENQRIIDVKKSLETGEIVWHDLVSRGISMKFN